MAELLLLSDDMVRAERRFRSLENLVALTIHDLYEPYDKRVVPASSSPT